MTNIEKIRAMSAEELAEFLYDITDCCSTENCLPCLLKKNCAYYGNDENIEEWLLEEVEE